MRGRVNVNVFFVVSQGTAQQHSGALGSAIRSRKKLRKCTGKAAAATTRATVLKPRCGSCQGTRRSTKLAAGLGCASSRIAPQAALASWCRRQSPAPSESHTASTWPLPKQRRPPAQPQRLRRRLGSSHTGRTPTPVAPAANANAAAATARRTPNWSAQTRRIMTRQCPPGSLAIGGAGWRLIGKSKRLALGKRGS